MANETVSHRNQIMGKSNVTGETRIIRTNEAGDIIAEMVSTIKGTATSGTSTSLVDTTKNFGADLFNSKIIKMLIDNIDYYRSIIDTTENTVTFAKIKDAVAATAVVGAASGGQVTISATPTGISGNDYTVSIVAAPGSDDNLSASLSEGVLTVYLGKSGGELSDAKNTGTLVAAEIDKVPEFTATMTGSNGDGVVAVTATPIPFTGGLDELAVSAGDEYIIIL